MGPHYKLEIKVLEKSLIWVIYALNSLTEIILRKFVKTTDLRVTSERYPRRSPNTEASLTYNISLTKHHHVKSKGESGQVNLPE